MLSQRIRSPLRRRIGVALFAGSLVLLGLFHSGTFGISSEPAHFSSINDNHYEVRHLLSVSDSDDDNRSTIVTPGPSVGRPSAANCSPAAIENFPPVGLTSQQRRQGGVLLYMIVAAYMFWALAIVCDEFFVPACVRVCDVLNLQSDVAGATFMAAGSSAPELATALIGVFVAENDIALGAVVGSAVFNILFVISFCALFGGTVIYLHWFPLVRDCIFYAISILALVISIYDEYIQWYEALILVILYIVYICFMVVNKHVEDWVVPRFSMCNYEKQIDTRVQTEMQSEAGPRTDSCAESENEDAREYGTGLETHSLLSAMNASDDDLPNMQLLMKENGTTKHASCTLDFNAEKKLLGDDEENEWLLAMPKSCCGRIGWVLSLPLTILMFVTIPDVRRPRWQNWWIVTFITSSAWIGVYSYIMVWMITVIGQTFGVPDTVMGITFIAAGASIPDVISSFLVLKDGYGDMAVSNAIGSNIFDILMCMGLPYFVRALYLGGGVEVYSQGLLYSSILLFTTVILLVLSLHIHGWRLTVRYGVFLMVLYILITFIAILFELNIFGNLRLPTCPTSM